MKSKLLICTHEYPPFHGGIGMYCKGIVDAAVSMDYDVLVLSVQQNGKRPGLYNEDGINVLRALPEGKLSVWKLARAIFIYNRVLRKEHDRSIYSMDWMSWKILSLINLVHKCPYSLTLYGSEIISTFNSARNRILGHVALFRSVQKIRFISVATKNLFKKYFATVDIPSSIAYPGINPYLQLKTDQETPQNNEYTKIHILTVARIEERKGQVDAARILRKVESTTSVPIRWTLIGKVIDSRYHDRLLAEIEQMTSQVDLLGAVETDDLISCYQSADIFILPGSSKPNRWEGFGMVYIEAGVFGVPSVATRWAGIPEAVLDKRSGLLSEPGDLDALFNNLKQLIENPEYRNLLGEGAKAHSQHFSWSKTAEMTFTSESKP